MTTAVSTLTTGAPKLPDSPIQRIVDIDTSDARVSHDRATNVLTLGLYSNQIDVPLNTFTGKVQIIGGGSTIDLERNHINGPIELTVNYYWCGCSRDEMIYEKHRFNGQDWEQLKYRDRT